MEFMNGGMILGIFFILFGLSLVLKVVFNITIPVFRVLFGIALIYFGAKLIFSNPHQHGKFSFPSGSAFVSGTALDSEYNVIFGYSVIDLSKMDTIPDKLEINTIFGKSDLILPQNRSFEIQVTSAFGGVYLPDGSIISFGERTFKTTGSDDTKTIRIKTSTVFAGSTISIRE